MAVVVAVCPPVMDARKHHQLPCLLGSFNTFSIFHHAKETKRKTIKKIFEQVMGEVNKCLKPPPIPTLWCSSMPVTTRTSAFLVRDPYRPSLETVGGRTSQDILRLIPSRSLTVRPWKIYLPNRKVVFQPPFFRCYVELRGCTSPKKPHKKKRSNPTFSQKKNGASCLILDK